MLTFPSSRRARAPFCKSEVFDAFVTVTAKICEVLRSPPLPLVKGAVYPRAERATFAAEASRLVKNNAHFGAGRAGPPTNRLASEVTTARATSAAFEDAGRENKDDKNRPREQQVALPNVALSSRGVGFLRYLAAGRRTV